MDKDELLKLLKENLTVRFDVESVQFEEYKKLEVRVLYDDEVICEDCDFL